MTTTNSAKKEVIFSMIFLPYAIGSLNATREAHLILTHLSNSHSIAENVYYFILSRRIKKNNELNVHYERNLKYFFRNYNEHVMSCNCECSFFPQPTNQPPPQLLTTTTTTTMRNKRSNNCANTFIHEKWISSVLRLRHGNFSLSHSLASSLLHENSVVYIDADK